MEQIIHDTFDKVKINEERNSKIKESIMTANKAEHKMPAAFRFAVAAAFALAVTMCIPVTRNAVFAAVEYVKQTYFMADGSEVVKEESDNEVSYTVSAEYPEYTEVAGGRLYFVLNGEKTDVTDQCGETDYYRHEVINEDGSKSVILVGGTPENSGWVELLFDAKGNYVFNRMCIPAGGVNLPWSYIAMHNEGVPTGNPYYDDKLEDDK